MAPWQNVVTTQNFEFLFFVILMNTQNFLH